MKTLSTVIAASMLCSAVGAQEKIPVLKGKMDLSIKQGTMVCDFTLTNLPPVSDYYIRLNAGMNLRYIRNMEDNYSFSYERDYNNSTGYESFGYYIPNSKGKVIRDGYRFSYTGKFPVIADTLKSAAADWKGNIAFNGYSVRCDGLQATWYPVFYDKATDKTYEKVKYDIEINCSDCNTIYVNGKAPVQGKKAHFKGDDPTQLMLYAGNYKVINDKGTYFLNADLSAAQVKEFGTMTKQFKDFYEQKLGIPYKYNITYIQTTPVAKDFAWMFVAYPTIVNIGYGEYGMKGLFDKSKGAWFRTYMAHELGHYYFGTYKSFNAVLGDMMGEGFAEYLALKATKQLFTDSLYNAKVDKMIKDTKDFKPLPFNKIKKDADYANRELYVYNYAPLVFLAIEKEIGTERMWQWLHTILVTPADLTDYKFLKQTLAATLNDEDKAQAIREKYFTSPTALADAVATIKGK